LDRNVSVTYVCPACAKAAQFASFTTRCAYCHELLPEQLRQSLQSEVEKERLPPRPILLTVGIVGSFAVGGLALLFVIFSPLNMGHYSINGRVVTGPEFFRRFGVFLAVAAATCLPIGYALLRELPWSRHLMAFFWAGTILATFFSGLGSNAAFLSCTVGMMVLEFAIAAWYLYRKRNVVAYFRALERVPPSAVEPPAAL
jgi:hypothetical protein